MTSSHKRKEKSSPFAARPQELPSREHSLEKPQLLGQEGRCTTDPSPQALGQLLSKPSLFISHLQVKPVDVSCSGEICITWDNLGLADCSFVPVAPSLQCTDTQTHAQPDLWQGWGGQALDQSFQGQEPSLHRPIHILVVILHPPHIIHPLACLKDVRIIILTWRGGKGE